MMIPKTISIKGIKKDPIDQLVNIDKSFTLSKHFKMYLNSDKIEISLPEFLIFKFIYL